MMKPEETIKVSVLMLTYNQERYIDEAIRSVMLQETDFRFELVIGNDASTDRTDAICRKWRDAYPQQIRLFSRERNLGLIGNFLQTYANCRGKYVAICEGDDFWIDRHKLQIQADFLDAHPDCSTCFHRVINYFEDNGTKSLSNGGGQKTDTCLTDLARSNYITNVSAVFRKGLFGDFPDWFAQVSTYDYALHMLNAQYGDIHYINRPMAVYRQHGKAIWSMTGMDRKLDTALTVRELLVAHFEQVQRTEVCDALRNAHTQICLNLIRYYRQVSAAESKIREAEERLLRYRPEWSRQELAAKEIPLKPTARERVMRVLKKVRGMVSLFIPLPRIKER